MTRAVADERLRADGAGAAARGTGPGAARAARREEAAVLLLAVVVALVRFLRLGEWSLWHDEALTLSDALEGTATALHNRLGYLLLSIPFELFPGRPDELWLRFVPACLGVLTVPVTWWAFRPFAGGRAAAAAALVVAASSWHVYWSQNARFYTLAQVLALAGGALVLRGLWRASWRATAAGTVLALLAGAAHPSALFLAGALVAAPWALRLLGLRPPDGGRRAAWIALLVVPGIAAVAGAGWAVEVVSTWAAKKSAQPAHFLLTVGYYFTPILGTAALVGAVVGIRRRAPFETLAALVCAAVVGAATLASLGVRMSAQYVFVLFPWVAVLAAAPLRVLGRAAAAAWLAMLVLPAAADLALYFTVRHGDRPRWREAYRYVFDHEEPGDLVLGMEAPVGEYYLDPDPRRTSVRRWRNVTYLDHFRADVPDRWARYPRRTWFVVNLEQLQDWGAEARGDMRETLREECRLVASFPVRVPGRDLDVLVYLRE